MCQEMTLQEALQKIAQLEAENKMKDEKIADLTTKLEKSEAENEKFNMLLEENDNEWANSMRDVKEEIQELRDRIEDLENREDDLDDDIVYPEAQTEGEAQWFDVKNDDAYEIKNIFPYNIRRKRDGKNATESVNKKSGYIQITLNGKPYQKHILVAKHFIPNPYRLPIIDHKDHVKTNYHTTNLRWASIKENNRNRSSSKGVEYEYVDTIPDEAIKVDSYGNHTFDNYFFHDNIFYFYTGINYRKLHINEDKYGNKSVKLIDEEGKGVSVYYSKFKKEHGIPTE